MGSKVDSTIAVRALNAIKARLQEKFPEVLAATGAAIAAQVAARMPSPQEEYETMMYGDGNPEGLPPVMGPPGSAGDGAEGDGRIRFIKDPDRYLQPWMLGRGWKVTGNYVGIGDVDDLEAISTYEWQNRGAHHTSAWSWWSKWESGGTFHVVPQTVSKNGHDYPLMPARRADMTHPLFEMTKTIPKKRMFGGVDLATAVETTLIPAVRAAARQAAQ